MFVRKAIAQTFWFWCNTKWCCFKGKLQQLRQWKMFELDLTFLCIFKKKILWRIFCCLRNFFAQKSFVLNLAPKIQYAKGTITRGTIAQHFLALARARVVRARATRNRARKVKKTAWNKSRNTLRDHARENSCASARNRARKARARAIAPLIFHATRMCAPAKKLFIIQKYIKNLSANFLVCSYLKDSWF